MRRAYYIFYPEAEIRVRAVTRIAVGAALVAVLSLFGLLFANVVADLLPQRDVYEGAGRLLPLLAALGFAGCIGYLSIHLACKPGCALLAGPAFVGPALAGNSLTGGIIRIHERWPILVTLFLGALPLLLAGLGGWV